MKPASNGETLTGKGGNFWAEVKQEAGQAHW